MIECPLSSPDRAPVHMMTSRATVPKPRLDFLSASEQAVRASIEGGGASTGPALAPHPRPRGRRPAARAKAQAAAPARALRAWGSLLLAARQQFAPCQQMSAAVNSHGAQVGSRRPEPDDVPPGRESAPKSAISGRDGRGSSAGARSGGRMRCSRSLQCAPPCQAQRSLSCLSG